MSFYSYNLGDWHILSLNSNCDRINCNEDGAQAQWLFADLSAQPGRCSLAVWHHPLWSSGLVPILGGVDRLWRIVSQFGVEVVVNGHDHHYERTVPLDINGRPAAEGGIRAFISGTGGAQLFELNPDPLDITQARDNTSLGVLLFRLYPGYYEWEFIPVDESGFRDAGSGVCW